MLATLLDLDGPRCPENQFGEVEQVPSTHARAHGAGFG